MKNCAQMISFSQEIVQQAIQQCMDKSSNNLKLVNADIAYLCELRTQCFEAIYHLLENTDFSQYAEISAIFENMIEEKNKQFALEGETYKVNEKKFKINHSCQIVSAALLESDTFKNHNEKIDNYLDEKFLKEQEARKSIVEFNGEKIQSIAHTNVLWSGWECDSTAWVIEQDDKNVLLASDHGQVKITNKSFLENKIKEYEETIENTKKMLALL